MRVDGLATGVELAGVDVAGADVAGAEVTGADVEAVTEPEEIVGATVDWEPPPDAWSFGLPPAYAG